MKRYLMPVGAAAAASLLAAAAIAQPMSGARGGPPMGPGSMQAPMMGGALPAPEYVRKAAQSDEFEIAEAHLAIARSSNPHVLQFARRMIVDHSKSTMMIKAAVRRSMGMTPPPAMSSEQMQMLASLRSAAPGPAFDRMYIDQQVQAHQMALDVHQGYASNGTDHALRHAARMIVPVVQMHLSMVQMMQSHMG